MSAAALWIYLPFLTGVFLMLFSGHKRFSRILSLVLAACEQHDRVQPVFPDFFFVNVPARPFCYDQPLGSDTCCIFLCFSVFMDIRQHVCTGLPFFYTDRPDEHRADDRCDRGPALHLRYLSGDDLRPAFYSDAP